MKTYLLRSSRYLLRMVIILGVVFLIMALTNTLNVEPGQLFRAVFMSKKGVLLIVLLLALAAFYPKLSFTTLDIRASLSESREALLNAFATCGYELTQEEPGRLVFRAQKPIKRLLLQWDDAITVTADGSYISLEGLKKEVSRIELRLSAFLGR